MTPEWVAPLVHALFADWFNTFLGIGALTGFTIMIFHSVGRRPNFGSLLFVWVCVSLLFALFDTGLFRLNYHHPQGYHGQVNPHLVREHDIWLVHRWVVWGLASTIVCWWFCRKVVERPLEESPE